MTREPMWRRYRRFWGPDVAADVDEELAFLGMTAFMGAVAAAAVLGPARRAARLAPAASLRAD